MLSGKQLKQKFTFKNLIKKSYMFITVLDQGGAIFIHSYAE